MNGAPYLLAAVCARALAGSAVRAGLPVVALDLFDDADTRQATIASRRVAAGRALKFARKRLIAAADELAPAHACAGVVYGSGFEAEPALLAALSANRKLYGNTPDTLGLVKRPASFFGLLDRCSIPHPEVSLKKPARAAGWLAKRTGGAGGVHVRWAERLSKAGEYYQRYETGKPMSALFLADGKSARVIGFSEQWMREAPYSFCFGGAASHADLPQAVRSRVEDAIARLTVQAGVVGLNGLDFLVRGETFSVLELNPRPTSTLDLYDADYSQGLFYWHLRACEGVLPVSSSSPNRIRAHSIVFAVRPTRVATGMRWPAWVTDRPRPGAMIWTGAPICTVHAEAATRPAVSRLITERRAAIEGMLARRAA
jgi:predicted ATP-grasp superfamily ATP-dependent carboligase